MNLTAFSGLVAEEDFPRVVRAFDRAITRSFDAHGMSHPTRAEVKARFDACVRILRVLRGDMRWGLTKSLDHVPAFLADELAGRKWEPRVRASWIVGPDGNPVDSEKVLV